MQLKNSIFKRFVIALSVITVGVALLYYFFSQQPKLNKVILTKEPVAVEVTDAKKENKEITITAYGTVIQHKQLSLKTQVSGLVMEMDDNFIQGGQFKRGHVLLQIDKRDYLNAVEQAKSSLEATKLDLATEYGSQLVAKEEWTKLKKDIGKDLETHQISDELALRKPHLRQKIEQVRAAESELENAQLNLERTTIITPINAIIQQESVEKGEFVLSGDPIALLLETDQFDVQVSVPINQLKWINIKELGDKENSKVVVYQNVGGESVEIEGKILRFLTDVDPNGRMVRIIIGIEDPLRLENGNEGKTPFFLNTYARVVFSGKTLHDVFLVPNEALHENATVWIANDKNELAISDVKVVYQGENYTAVSEGIKVGDRIIVSQILNPKPGMPLRVETTDQNGNQEDKS